MEKAYIFLIQKVDGKKKDILMWFLTVYDLTRWL